MTKKEPFLTGFPTTICGKIRRRLQDAIAARRRSLTESSIATYALQFAHILPAIFLHEQSNSKRMRHYCNVVVFWAWLAQILEANASCSKAVSLIQAWCDDSDLPRPSADTGAYCKARSRVKLAFLRIIRARVNSHLRSRIRPEDKWRGFTLKSLDGSSVKLMDTEENQEIYPQPSSQKPGCGFPVMGIMGVLNHAHGGWEDFAVGPQSAHDAPVAHKLFGTFSAGDLVCGDRAFCSYENIAGIRKTEAHCLMRLHQARHRALDLRKGKRIAKNQRLVTWAKPKKQPTSSPLTKEEWEALPETMEIRYIAFWYEDRAGKKRRMILATTLLDPAEFDWLELSGLYAQRWDIELRLRDVKTTLGMEMMAVKTPETAHKTLEMTIIAYNLIKATCQEAAHASGESIRLMSFKGALDTVVASTTRYRGRQKHPRIRNKIWQSIIEIVSEKLIDLRPGRSEPRAQKKRPKPYSYLTLPRAIFKELQHRGKHRSYA